VAPACKHALKTAEQPPEDRRQLTTAPRRSIWGERKSSIPRHEAGKGIAYNDALSVPLLSTSDVRTPVGSHPTGICISAARAPRFSLAYAPQNPAASHLAVEDTDAKRSTAARRRRSGNAWTGSGSDTTRGRSNQCSGSNVSGSGEELLDTARISL